MMNFVLSNFLRRSKAWGKANPHKIRLLGGLGAFSGSYYVYHLEKTPITGRIRFINIGADQEEDISNQSLDEILKTNRHRMLPPTHPICLEIKSIVDNLAKNINNFIPDIKTNFRVYVIDNPEPNAFVLPDGQIFVNTGLLPVALNEDGLATVLAHEIAHKLARHGAEKMSTYQFFSIIIGTAQLILTGDMHNPLTNFMKTVLLDLPFSRKCEKEADYIGLLLMAKSCYDPEEAVNLWQRMSDKSKISPEITTFLSTHPSHKKRIENIRSWLPEAKILFYNSECRNLLFQFFNKSHSKYD